ncbi:MAG: bi-domain-containing oxidoreductase [Nitrospirota bacterium]|nr:bi-domain-containing oxidoreductase [Nitrospirota bacterium]
MKQVLIKRGQAIVEEVPSPKVEAGHVLVETEYSCISIGTEMSGVKEGAKSLLQRAIEHPEQVVLAARMAVEQGIGRTLSVVRGVLESGYPTGYSAAGTVREVGAGITDFKIGDRVACAGAGIANHAEILNMPGNLLVKIPENLDFREASTVTLGAIALQGIRRANPTLGETFLVMGLGILGQLTAQMLKANGCRVVGFDPDKSRVDQARELGMEYGISPDEDAVARVVQLTDGYGADGVIITAATASDEVVSQAFQSCRKKGRVVLVGDVGLRLRRGDFYAKEIDFLISTSYGPGRYEPNYEKKGLDYPIGYVRWTENRNMREYVSLLSENRINLEPLIQKEYSLDDAPTAYEELKTGKDKPLMVLLRYEKEGLSSKLTSHVGVTTNWQKREGQLRIALIGGGDFAKGMHLPNLRRLDRDYSVYAVMSRTGANAKAIARQFEAKYATTDHKDILKDSVTDAVLISTRHNLHAAIAMDAVKAGKHVFVEKPMALDKHDLISLCSLLTGKEMPDDVKSIASHIRAMRYELAVNFLVGFNRRFSPFMQRARRIVSSRTNPMIINYRMNAGFIPLTHWVHGEEGGGRNIGEACHIYDLFNFLTDAEAESISAHSVTPATEQYAENDNFIATIKYKDGSVCNLIYTALGSKDYPKEEMEIYVDNKIIKMSDYRKLDIFGSKEKGLATKTVEKGHLQELEAFARAIKEGTEAIPLWQQVQATEISFEVEKKIFQ